jgi:hypothetical protein
MSDQPDFVQRLGVWLAIFGATCLGAVFLIVLANGTWPQFLAPIQSRMRFLGDHLGDWAIVAEFWIAAGPGALLYWIGGRRRLRNRTEHPTRVSKSD